MARGLASWDDEVTEIMVQADDDDSTFTGKKSLYHRHIEGTSRVIFSKHLKTRLIAQIAQWTTRNTDAPTVTHS